MKINFTEEVLKRKAEIIEKTVELLKINSEMTGFDLESKAPFGPGINEALQLMLNLGAQDGFATLNADGYAGHIEYGNQDEYIGMIGHLDVVPAGSNWDYPPYEAKIVDGKIYARGAMDDKGPTMAAYFAMKIIKELDLPLSKRIKLILGTDEETAWRCVDYYFKKFPEQPVFGFIPDAGFPLTYAEKGILNVKVNVQVEKNNILDFKAGLRANMVPDQATVTLADLKLKDKFLRYLSQNKYQGFAEIKDEQLSLTISGQSAHGSKPEKGVNAAYLLINFLIENETTNEFTDLVNTYLIAGLDGKKMGVDHYDNETGSVTVNAGVFNLVDDVYEIVLNIRYPNGVDPEDFIKRLTQAFNSLDADVEVLSHQKRLYINPDNENIQTILNVYKKHTGDQDAKPLTTGGGTFARAMENSVAFGPGFPGKPSYIHQPNEYLEIEDLLKMTMIYAESLYELAK
ncbi:MAG: dipeptidase PepV [Acholeplasmataceae bacterium]|jgi:succinyl-diaminopimelate desuccinylase|nr:dipeptidase PepV [Acholeplasmataceae bacterium]